MALKHKMMNCILSYLYIGYKVNNVFDTIDFKLVLVLHIIMYPDNENMHTGLHKHEK